MLDAIANEKTEEASFFDFYNGGGKEHHMMAAQGDKSQQLFVGDHRAATNFVSLDDNEKEMTEFFRVLQASHGGLDFQNFTETIHLQVEPFHTFEKVKEDSTNAPGGCVPPGIEEQSPPNNPGQFKRKRGRPPKVNPCSGTAEVTNRKTGLFELPSLNDEPKFPTLSKGLSGFRSSRLREKAAKLGGLLNQSLPANQDNKEKMEEPIESIQHNADYFEESKGYKCEECPDIKLCSLEDFKNHRKELHPIEFHLDNSNFGFDDQNTGFPEHTRDHCQKTKKLRGRPRKSTAAVIQSSEIAAVSVSNSKFAEIPNVVCKTCAKEFRNIRMLEAHIRNSHPDVTTEAFICNHCNASFRLKEAMEVHIENVHGGRNDDNKETELTEKPPSTSEETTELDSLIFEDEDVKVHSDDEEGIDNDEDLEEKDEDETLQESGIAEYDSAVDGYCCQLCGAVFSAKKRLIQHLKDDHHIRFKRGRRAKQPPVETAEDGTFPCPVCERKFVNKNSLAYHVRTHTGERPHQCEVCGKSFLANGALKTHMRLHTGDRPYKCGECGREFRQSGDLKYHFISLHSGSKQYQCEFCGKSFARKYSLSVHRKVHTGERNYKCEFCGKGFRASSYLVNHRRVHTGEKPHPCPVCLKPFRMRSDMKRHMQMHARDGSDVSVHQRFDANEEVTANQAAVSVTEGKTANKRTPARGSRKAKSEEAAAVASILEDGDDGSVMLSIVANDAGEMIAVPVCMENSRNETRDMEVFYQAESEPQYHGLELEELQLINFNSQHGEHQQGLDTVTTEDPNTNYFYVWSPLPGNQQV